MISECKYSSSIHILTLKLGRISNALALNIGSDSWELTQVALAFATAEAQNHLFKIFLFLSIDFTSYTCTLSDIVKLVNKYGNHSNQFKVNGKPMVSSYEGGCLGNSGWQSLKEKTNAYIMAFISGLEGHFSEWPALDSWYWLV